MQMLQTPNEIKSFITTENLKFLCCICKQLEKTVMLISQIKTPN